jgi:hypothetical protein
VGVEVIVIGGVAGNCARENSLTGVSDSSNETGNETRRNSNMLNEKR